MGKVGVFAGSKNPNWHGGDFTLHCMVCGKPFTVKSGRKDTAKCCSLPCWNLFQKSSHIHHPCRNPNTAKGVRKKEWIKVQCKECQKEIEVTPSKVGLKLFCSTDCQFRWRSRRMSGANNPNWVNADRNGYPPDFYKIRESILARDGYRCASPLCRTNDDRVHVHHIDFNKQNCSPDNLISVCPSCNARANFQRIVWKAILSNFLKWRILTGEMNLGFRGQIIFQPATL